MKKLQKYFEPLKEILVYAYIWQIPFSWRYIIDPSRSSLDSGFNEYMDISLYIGEILLIFALLIHIIEYKINKKSIDRNNFSHKVRNLFHVEHIFLYMTVTILIGLNIYFSIDQYLSIMTVIHWFFLFILIYLLNNLYVSRGTYIIKSISSIFLCSIIFQTIIAASQFLSGHSIGMGFLNESILSVSGVNVAKAHIFSKVYLRGYGTFSHPNVLAAYSVFVMIFFIMIRKEMFHVKHYPYFVAIVFSLIAIFFSQSKTAMFFVFMVFLYWFLNKRKSQYMFHVEHIIYAAFFILSTLILLIFTNFDAKNSFQTRLDQYQVQLPIDKITPLGLGFGTYRISYEGGDMEWWKYEPVHFTPVIILAEWGIILSIVTASMLYQYLSNVPRETLNRSLLPIAYLFFILVTDHYAWDIYQGTFLFVASLIAILYIDKTYNILHNIKHSVN